MKKFREHGNRYMNMGHSVVSDETDPALLLTNSKDTSRVSTNRQFAVTHPFRNVFTNGEVRLTFDMRAPDGYTSSGIYCWLGPIFEQQLNNANNYVLRKWPLQAGFSAATLSGAWRDPDGVSGDRKFVTWGQYTRLNWYRFDILMRLDSSEFDLTIYDLGTGRIDIDATPGGAPFYSNMNNKFVSDMNADDGGLAGLGIVCSYYDTGAAYGETGFNDDLTPKFDNIRASYKAPEAGAFVDFYRNTFDKSMRRTVDGRATLSHTYALAEAVETNTVALLPEYVRASDNYATSGATSSSGAPFLNAGWDSALASVPEEPQRAGVDGWRLAGYKDYQGPICVTSNGDNRVFFTPSYTMARHPMCPNLTSGMFKFEFDQRMPAGWNGTPRCDVDLMSYEAYETGINNTADSRIRVGLGGNGTSGTQAAPNKTFYAYVGSYRSDQPLKALTWYRIQIIGDLDAKTFSVYYYEIGAAAPAMPDDFTPGTAVATCTNHSMASPSGLSQGIGAVGISNWLRCLAPSGESAADYCMYIDNLRLWKQVDGAWQQLYENRADDVTRMGYTKKSANLTPTPQIDRPEYGVDGLASAPTYANGFVVAGNDAVHEVQDRIYSVVHPLGRNVKHGQLSLQYDVRVPTTWGRPGTMNYFWIQLGGPTMLSASTWENPFYRYHTCPAIRTGIQVGYNGYIPLTDTGGIYNRTVLIAVGGEDGSNSGLRVTKAKHIPAASAGWYRFKIDANLDTHKYDCTVYDMGQTHPTLDTPDGVAVDGASWTDIDFFFNLEPISAIHIIGGYTFSYAPWRDDAPGALLLDNIRIKHHKRGTTIYIR